jgi:hypothetical protein
MFTKKPFTALFMNGFVQKDDDTAVGTVDRYTVIVNYVLAKWGFGDFSINVLFDKDFTVTKANISDIKKRNKPSIWNEGAIGKLLTYNFTPPSYEKVSWKLPQKLMIKYLKEQKDCRLQIVAKTR